MAKHVGQEGAAHWSEHVDVARVCAWLRWHMCDTVATDYVAAEEVSTREGQDYLRPARHVT